jgi:HEAT repeat protein
MAISPETADQISAAISRISGKLAQVRGQGLECFGSQRHHFVLARPLSEAAAVRFEEEHGLLLPEGYRAFLTRLGNGGAGPYYGLLPLERCAADSGQLARPSPLKPGIRGLSDADTVACLEPESLLDGAITLVQQGCTYSSLLIVTGPHRGCVVNFDLDLSAPPDFARDAGFLPWYERWLDELLWGWDNTWFGYGLPGQEPALAAVLQTPPYADRREALRTLARIPALTGDTLAAVRACVDDEDAAVRAAATSLLGRHQGAAAARLVTGLLGDPDPAVRCAALTALPALTGDRADRCRAALTDPDPDVVRTALRLLADDAQLDESDVAPLLQAGRPDLRMTAVWYLEKTSASSVPAAMFGDPDPGVVRQAVLTSGSLRDRQSVALLLRLLSSSGDPDLRTLIVKILGRLGAPAAFDALVTETTADDAFTRLEAARALGELADARARPALHALLTDTTRPRRADHNGMLRSMSTQSIAQVAAEALRKLPRRGRAWRRRRH